MDTGVCACGVWVVQASLAFEAHCWARHCGGGAQGGVLKIQCRVGPPNGAFRCQGEALFPKYDSGLTFSNFFSDPPFVCYERLEWHNSRFGQEQGRGGGWRYYYYYCSNFQYLFVDIFVSTDFGGCDSGGDPTCLCTISIPLLKLSIWGRCRVFKFHSACVLWFLCHFSKCIFHRCLTAWRARSSAWQLNKITTRRHPTAYKTHKEFMPGIAQISGRFWCKWQAAFFDYLQNL